MVFVANSVVMVIRLLLHSSGHSFCFLDSDIWSGVGFLCLGDLGLKVDKFIMACCCLQMYY